MNRTKIDWCDMTWNPVTGCLHDCDYCYARKIAERFGGKGNAIYIPDRNGDYSELAVSTTGEPFPCKFTPTFYEHRLSEPQSIKKPQNVFVCSMADLFGVWVPDEWIQEVFKACEAAPQHRYLFLTKNPGRYIELASASALPEAGETVADMWFGTSTPTPEHEMFWSDNHHTFVSIEPIMERFGDRLDSCAADWIIVGAETGNRRSKTMPKREWIDDIARHCKENEIPLFMKESLRGLMGDDFVQEVPWDE